MSTKCTIAYSDDYHLYEEIGDRHNVYLRLDPGDWAASLTTATIDWDDGAHSRPILTVKMNIDMWRQIVQGWSASHWGKDASRDHKEPEWNLDDTWMERLRRFAEPRDETTNAKVSDDE